MTGWAGDARPADRTVGYPRSVTAGDDRDRAGVRPEDAPQHDRAAAPLVPAAGVAAGVGVQRIDDRETMQRVVDAVVFDAQREVCSMLPAGPYSIPVMRSSWDGDIALLRRGVTLCALYQAESTRTPEMLHYLSEFAAAGARVRVTRRVTHRAIVADRSTAVIAVEPDTLRLPYLLVREPALVRNIRAEFAALWRSAHSVGLGSEDTLAEATVREVLEILRSGVTDDVAARKLGVSTRTIRRRVAAVMDLLGASSRFEAGVRAAESGWLGPGGADHLSS